MMGVFYSAIFMGMVAIFASLIIQTNEAGKRERDAIVATAPVGQRAAPGREAAPRLRRDVGERKVSELTRCSRDYRAALREEITQARGKPESVLRRARTEAKRSIGGRCRRVLRRADRYR